MDWDLVKAPLQGFVDCFDGAKLKGFLKAGGVYEPGITGILQGIGAIP